MMEPRCAVCGETDIKKLTMFNYGVCQEDGEKFRGDRESYIRGTGLPAGIFQPL